MKEDSTINRMVYWLLFAVVMFGVGMAMGILARMLP